MEEVWHGIIVSPETLTKRVNLLREAVDDDAQEPRYVVGVPSPGYQLIAPVSRAARLGRPPRPSLDHANLLGPVQRESGTSNLIALRGEKRKGVKITPEKSGATQRSKAGQLAQVPDFVHR
jgi:DNA-binding winged helix-turn-helix (wHTH) protein